MINANKYWKASAVELFCDGKPISEACEVSYKNALEYRDEPEELPFSGDDIDFHFYKEKPDWLLDIERFQSKRRQALMAHMMKVAKIARKKLRKKYHRNIMLKIEGYGNK